MSFHFYPGEFYSPLLAQHELMAEAELLRATDDVVETDDVAETQPSLFVRLLEAVGRSLLASGRAMAEPATFGSWM